MKSTPREFGDQTATVLAPDSKSVPRTPRSHAQQVETAPAPVAPSGRCLALVPGSGAHMTDELHCLLRRRLRVAGLIALSGVAIFFVKGLLAPRLPQGPQPLDLAIHASALAIMTALCALLWTRIPFSMRALRGIELGFFGAMAAFFGFLHMRIFPTKEFADWVVEHGQEKMLSHLATLSNSLRWFVLITLYGTFIPNTWKRCATVVGIMVLLPIGLTVFACAKCPIVSQYQAPALFDMSVILGTAAAIAIFGSYRIQELREEAFQAKKLGQYKLLRRIGKGGMGEVFLGEHTLLRRSCAIKLIRPDQAGDATNLSRFEREVRAMATLTHWNSVEVYDYGHAPDGTFYYVMEYLPGLSLQELVDDYGPLPPGRAIHFLRQLCGALREAHGIGLIHRDIKPSNVIVCERGGIKDVAKLLDFGLVVHNVNLGGNSGSSAKLTVQGTILGSPPYISPEQAMSKTTFDARTDIYSLGGLAYFLMTGQAPFIRDSAMELLVAHIHDAAIPPRELRSDIPHDLEEVLLKCLSKDPADRYPDAQSLDHALAACAAADQWDCDQAEVWWRDRNAPSKVEAKETEPAMA